MKADNILMGDDKTVMMFHSTFYKHDVSANVRQVLLALTQRIFSVYNPKKNLHEESVKIHSGFNSITPVTI